MFTGDFLEYMPDWKYGGEQTGSTDRQGDHGLLGRANTQWLLEINQFQVFGVL